MKITGPGPGSGVGGIGSGDGGSGAGGTPGSGVPPSGGGSKAVLRLATTRPRMKRRISAIRALNLRSTRPLSTAANCASRASAVWIFSLTTQ